MIKGRVELYKYFAKSGFKYGAEIGVSMGRGALLLCQNIPGLKLLCVDSWTLKPDKYKFVIKAFAKSRFDITIINKTSMKAVKDIPDGSLDFVFIDANHHFAHVIEDIVEWSKKVRKGGIVSGHDYFDFIGGGVIEAVNKYTKEHNIKFEITERTSSRDDNPCFYWIK